MEQAIAGYCRSTGQEVPPDRATLLRAVYESLALKYRVVAEEIGTVSGEQMRNVHIVGGGSRNSMLNQMTADACGLAVLAGPEEATAVGNAAVQGTALGVWPRLSEARKIIRSSFPCGSSGLWRGSAGNRLWPVSALRLARLERPGVRQSFGDFIHGVTEPDRHGTPSFWFVFRDERLLVSRSEADVEVPFLEELSSLGLSPVRRQFLGNAGGSPAWPRRSRRRSCLHQAGPSKA